MDIISLPSSMVGRVAGSEVLAEAAALEAEPAEAAELLDLEPLLPPQAARLRTIAMAMVKARNFFIMIFSFSIGLPEGLRRAFLKVYSMDIFTVNR